MLYGHVIMPSGETLAILAHRRCVTFVESSAIDMQTLILQRFNAERLS